jgi:hypothetical protein
MSDQSLLEEPATPSTEPAPVSTPRPADVPEKFWDAATGSVRLDALLKSYRALERRLAERDDEAVDRDALWAKLGRPETPDQYDIQCDHRYFTADPELNGRFHALGFNQDQVQAVYDLAREKLVPMILDVIADLEAERELERVVDHFGGPEKWAVRSRQLLAFGRKNLPDGLVEHLAQSFAGIKMLDAMMADRLGGGGAGGGQAPGLARDQGGLDRMTKLMNDPKYWRDRDPALMAKVAEGFERMYG